MEGIMIKEIQVYANKQSKDKWGEWNGFRLGYEKLLRETIERNNIITNRIMLLGAGNGNDMPIEFVESNFNEIILVDIDEKALQRFLEKVKIKEKFKTYIIDLSG